jgi:hypothetical protein
MLTYRLSPTTASLVILIFFGMPVGLINSCLARTCSQTLINNFVTTSANLPGQPPENPEKPVKGWQTPAAKEGVAVRNLEKALLGSIYISQIKPGQMHQAYVTFVQNLKEKSPAWTATDWANAEHIMNKLHFRRKALQAEISAEDKLKITALQAEYRALKTGNRLNPAEGSGN